VVGIRPQSSEWDRESARLRRKRRLGIPATAALVALSLGARVQAGVTPDMQRAVRAATFEVVLPKPAHDPLSYEKPLPFELIPYQQRTDKYRQVGTAFAVGPDTYVTAAHVLEAAVDSQYGDPALRGADGKVYPIASIVRFSADEDYAVFTLAGAPAPAQLAVDRSPRLDEPVFTVGNALGEGIVVRSGLFTSQTPEAQDGRWQWIRFSAAASPGNSGGPLLDALGKVIGIVIAKSPDENLNYALPIGIALDAPNKALFDKRFVVTLPFMQGYTIATLKDGFALPLTWSAFERTYQRVVVQHGDQALDQFIAAHADTLFPKGDGSDDILYSTVGPEPAVSVIIQQDNGEWTLTRPSFQPTYLPGNGKVSVASAAGVTLLRVVRADTASDDAFYADSRAFMDVALKGLVIRRQVGPVPVRVTSLGPALSDTLWTDRYGRKWQQRVWPLTYLDSYLIALLLPTPDGYVGLVHYSPSANVQETESALRLLADQVNLVYQGTLAQWSAFLQRRALLPDALAQVSLTTAPDWALRTPRFQMSVPPALVKLDEHSRLYLAMTYTAREPRPSWQVAGAWWYRSAEKRSYVGLWRQPLPPATARQSLRFAYTDMQRRLSPFNGQPIRVAPDEFTSTTVLQAPGSSQGTASAGVLYGLTIGFGSDLSVADIGPKELLAVASTRILEHGIGADMPKTSPGPDFESQLTGELDRWQRIFAAQDAQYGTDLRGRTISQDFHDYIVVPAREAMSSPPSEAAHAQSAAAPNGIPDLFGQMSQRFHVLELYWRAVSATMHNRDLWPSFLAHNHLPATTPHDASVLAATAALRQELAGNDPNPTWAKLANTLTEAYVDERKSLALRHTGQDADPMQPRATPCPAPANSTSGHFLPAMAHMSSLSDYYPISMRRAGVEGTVVLRVHIDPTGCVIAVGIAVSSGSDELDRAARRWAEDTSYLPGERDGHAIQYNGRQPVNFSLN
jgi:serine protease Do